MSGGSFNYLCFQVDETYVGKMQDAELDDMMEDLCALLHDLEWYMSGDYSKEDYRETVVKFKKKWLRGDVSERLNMLCNRKINELRDEMTELIGTYLPAQEQTREGA